MKLKREIIFRMEFDGTGILADWRTGELRFLNRTGAAICALLAEEDLTREEIMRRSEAPDDAARADIDAFLDSLLEKHLADD